eukprot:362294-Prymnesium_polylepis.1
MHAAKLSPVCKHGRQVEGAQHREVAFAVVARCLDGDGSIPEVLVGVEDDVPERMTPRVAL